MINYLLSRPTLYDEVMVEANLMEDVPIVAFSIFSKGILVRSRQVNVLGRTATFSFVPKFSYAPESTLLVYYINKEGRCVSDSVTLAFRNTLPNYVSFRGY